MKITIQVKANARKNEVVALGQERYLVYVNAPPLEGRANEKVIEVLADYFDKPKRSIVIVRGERGREKVVEIG